jgi:hypothetical protein
LATKLALSSAAISAVAIVIAACGGSQSDSGSADSAKAAAAAAITIKFPDTAVGPGVEMTQCVTMRLGNVAPIHVGALHNVLSESSHHLIVYRVSDTVEALAPTPCRPFTDTLDATKGSPLMVTQKKDDLLQLPAGVAYSLDANQMVRLEMHYINPSSTAKTVSSTSTFIPISDSDFKNEAGFLFIGNPDIKLPPKSQTQLGPSFFQIPAELSGVKFFAMTGHEHQLGTNVQVAMSTTYEDPGSMIYDVPGWLWSEPKTQVFDTPFTVPDNGGFTFTCSWNNTSDTEVTFGESANDEMCFFWAYYYPSQGARVCFHSVHLGGVGGGDACCPGDPRCSLVGGKQ